MSPIYLPSCLCSDWTRKTTEVPLQTDIALLLSVRQCYSNQIFPCLSAWVSHQFLMRSDTGASFSGMPIGEQDWDVLHWFPAWGTRTATWHWESGRRHTNNPNPIELKPPYNWQILSFSKQFGTFGFAGWMCGLTFTVKININFTVIPSWVTVNSFCVGCALQSKKSICHVLDYQVILQLFIYLASATTAPKQTPTLSMYVHVLMSMTHLFLCLSLTKGLWWVRRSLTPGL